LSIKAKLVWNGFGGEFIVNDVLMKDMRWMITELQEFLREVQDFILAINQGATARELDKIGKSIRGKKRNEIPAFNPGWPGNRKIEQPGADEGGPVDV